MFSVISKLNHSRSVRKASNFGQELQTSLVIRCSQEKCSALHVLLIDSCSSEISDSFMQCALCTTFEGSNYSSLPYDSQSVLLLLQKSCQKDVLLP